MSAKNLNTGMGMTKLRESVSTYIRISYFLAV
jgi:hypothetical protein